MLEAWTNGYDTYIAESAEAAREAMAAFTGEKLEDVPELDEWSRRDMRANFTIEFERDHKKERITKTIAEWIGENGPGFLASTEA